MKKLLLILLCLPFIGFGQITMPEPTDDRYLHSFEKIGTSTYTMYKEDRGGIFGNAAKMRRKVKQKAKEFAEKHNYNVQFVSQNIHPVGILGDWASFTYTFKLVNKTESVSVESSLSSEVYEKEIKAYLDTSTLSSIEGIYDYAGTFAQNQYRLAIIKDEDKFIAKVIESNNSVFSVESKKAIFEPTAIDGGYTIKWILGNGSDVIKSIAIEENGLIKFNYQIERGNQEIVLYKMYPKLNKKDKRIKNGEWAGNGSGIIISKSGYIITNHHVIDDADDIEVEFILDDEVQKFNAEIVQSDKVNDLAVIKIVDVNFDGVKELPYNFKTRSSDVGTKVYAFGYPMALSIMGKEIKVTDGIISSKTGYDGDITSYQISAPIQGGNSGGPLFDDKGNLIGINAAKLNVKIADNVGYSIKTSYVLNLIDILPKSIELPSNKKLASLPLTEQIKEITKYVVLVKVK
jgi:S1-C subfamily serine protease